MRLSVRSLLTLTSGVVLGAVVGSGWSTAASLRAVDSRPAVPAIVHADHGVRSGRWMVASSGALTWLAEDSALPVGATVPDAAWYERKNMELEGVNQNLQCQMKACDAP